MTQIQRIEEGLVISYEGSVFEFDNQNDTHIWFQNINTGAYICFSGDEFRKAHATQALLVLDSKITPTAITYEEAQVDEGPLSSKAVLIDTLSGKQKEQLERRLSYVKTIVAMGIGRGQRFLITDAAKKIAALRGEPESKVPSFPTLNRWMRAYELNRFEVSALLPKQVARKKAVRLEPGNETLIRKSIDHVIYQIGALRSSAVVRYYQDILKAENVQLRLQQQPLLVEASDSTLRRRIAAESQYDVCVARLGVREARQQFRMAKGVLPADYALQYAEIDHTQLNWWVIDDALMLPLGLPWLTVIRDRYSKVILGIYLTFRKTGLDSIFGAIRHSLYAHEKIRDIWPDIENNWLSSGFATTYVSDRGGDFLSPRYSLTLQQMGADTQYCERETPWHKGGVERFGGEHAELFECMQGRTFPFRSSPRGYNPKQHAVVRFSVACFLIHKWICDKYHTTAISRKSACPQELWLDSIAKVPPPLPPTLEYFSVLSGEIHSGSLSHEGVRFKWLSYANDHLDDLRRHIGLNKKVAFIPHTREMGHIHVIDPRTSKPFRVECRQYEYAAGKTRFQHEYAVSLSKGRLNGKRADETQLILMQTEAEISDDLANKLAKTETREKLNLWNIARRAGINSNDVMDGNPRTILDLVKQPPKRVSETQSEIHSPEPTTPATQFTDVPSFTWGF